MCSLSQPSPSDCSVSSANVLTDLAAGVDSVPPAGRTKEGNPFKVDRDGGALLWHLRGPRVVPDAPELLGLRHEPATVCTRTFPGAKRKRKTTSKTRRTSGGTSIRSGEVRSASRCHGTESLSGARNQQDRRPEHAAPFSAAPLSGWPRRRRHRV